MNLKMLEAKRLSKEELKSIEAGLAPPDCDSGLVAIRVEGTVWECVPFGGCRWAMGNYGEDGDENNGDNSGHGW